MLLERHECIPATQDMLPDVLYVSERFNTAIHLCPCGCRCPAVTPLTSSDGWSLLVKRGKPSLEPSVRMRTECGSHYRVTDGEVVWHGS